MTDDPVLRYLELGLRLGRHVDGFVDAYYGPADIAARVDAEPVVTPAALAADAARLLADLDAGDALDDAHRRHWLRAQVVGLHTSAEKFAGADIAYVDEVERCYGVRPERTDEDLFAAAHRRLDEVLPGSGSVAERMLAWRDTNVVPRDRIEGVVADLADDLEERTDRRFGLPEGNEVEWILETDKPWSGFNYYLGDLRSRVAINIDLPVPSPSIGHLVAHEAFPGHHTEHCRKEVGLVRQRRHLEETIFLVGTPQCVVAEGLADLGLEIVVPDDRWGWLAGHLADHGIDLDPEAAAAVATASEMLGRVRANVALLLNEDGADVDTATDYLEHWTLVSRTRAEKQLSFLTDPTWRAYIHCYVDGLPLCRSWVNGDADRFASLVSDQHTPADLAVA